MPIYEYRCDNGHTLEVLQRMSDDALPSCTTCHAPVKRVFHPVAVHFKGSGFYATDYARNRGTDSEDGKKASDDSSKDSSDKSSKSESSESKPKAASSESKSSKTSSG